MQERMPVSLKGDLDQELKRMAEVLQQNPNHSSSTPLIEVTPENCAYLDDLISVFSQHGIHQVEFILPELEQFSANQLFHLIGFFDKLSKASESPVEVRAGYAKTLWALQNHQAGIAAGAPQPPGKQTNLEKALNLARRYARKYLPPPSAGRYHNPVTEKLPEWESVLVTGWYGTETSGDKAILGELLHRLWGGNPQLKVTVTSIDPKVSRKTSQEFGWGDQLAVVDLNHAGREADRYDAVIFGGGPIMETAKLEQVAEIFIKANAARRARVLFGCGVGPIWSDRIRHAAAQICRTASAGFFRDAESLGFARRLGAGSQLEAACDPSVAFVDRWRKNHATPGRDDGRMLISTLLREQTREFYRDSNPLNGLNQAFSAKIAQTLRNLSDAQPDAEVQMLAMHMYWRGMDDRLFNRKIAAELEGNLPVSVVREYLDLFSVLERLSRSDAAVAMRYHSHLFSIALGVPFLSIDYTGERGKVANLMGMIGYQDYLEEYDSYDSNSASEKLMQVISEREQIRTNLLAQTEVLVHKLEDAFADLFGAPA
ncbi:MAG: polysaccharide pyruvyl transferase family protein [Anaerolineales bacterium]|nr:polysaccharide pyruvyl transferase family protein [Anaerolineales bacterium]